MLENPTDSNIGTYKRYAPPHQRNRSLGRRKFGGDRLERASSYANDGDNTQAATIINVSTMDHEDSPRLIGLHGCGNGEAYQLLNNRWAAAVNAYENPSIDLAEWPVMYSGSCASACEQIRLPHQMVSPMAVVVGPSRPQIDFIRELSQAMHNADGLF